MKTAEQSIAEKRERAKLRRRAWKLANKDKVRESDRKYNASHGSERHRRREAKKRGCTIDPKGVKRFYEDANTLEAVKCHLCGQPIPKGKRQVDHVKPLALGGAHAVWNLAYACGSCNGSKSARDPSEFGLLAFNLPSDFVPEPGVPAQKYTFFHAVYAPDGFVGTRAEVRRAFGLRGKADGKGICRITDGRSRHFRGWMIGRVYAWAKKWPRYESRADRLALRGSIVPLTNKGRCFVPLGAGFWAIIDPDDWDRVMTRRWQAWKKVQGERVYWRAKAGVSGKLGGLVLLNRFVMQASDGVPVRHVNGDQLDCRKANLLQSRRKARRPRPSPPGDVMLPSL